jgi:hypothetical protein
MAKPPSRPSTTKVPPRGKGGAGQPSARPVPPRPPRKPNDRRRGGRSQRRFYGLLIGAVIAVAALIIIVVVATGGGSSSVTTGSKQPAVNYTTATGVKVYGGLGPENVPLQVGTPLAAANTGLTGAPIDGVQCNTTEQLTYHHHAHLVIFINGKTRPVPLGVGMVPPAIVEQTANGDWATGSQTCLYWLHVHAQDGIVHIESPSPKNFLLGQFFGVWHQALSSTQIGPYSGHVTATVNGQPWAGDPSEIPLTEHAQIVLNLGGPAVTPPPIDWGATQL